MINTNNRDWFRRCLSSNSFFFSSFFKRFKCAKVRFTNYCSVEQKYREKWNHEVVSEMQRSWLTRENTLTH